MNGIGKDWMKYKTIYIDPPWTFTGAGSFRKKMAPSKYDVMSIDDIRNMKQEIDELSDDNCLMFMWVTSCYLKEAIEILEHWNFKYITNICWYKPHSFGLGRYIRTEHELCLIARKGKHKFKATDVRSVIVSKRRQHSRKPDEMYDIIERIAHPPYIELFARNRHTGWDSQGNEVDKF